LTVRKEVTMAKNILVYEEVKHSDYLVEVLNTDTGRYEWTELPENITVTTTINDRDIQEGMKNATPVQM